MVEKKKLPIKKFIEKDNIKETITTIKITKGTFLKNSYKENEEVLYLVR